METTEYAPETSVNRPPYPSLKQAWGLILLLIAWQFPLAIPYFFLEKYGKAQDWNVPAGLAEMVLYVAAFGLTIWFAMKRRRRPLAFGPVNATFLIWPVLAIGTLTFGLLLEPLTSILPVPEWLDKALSEALDKDAILSAVLAAPILEEILLRGIIADGMLRRYTPAQAIGWSAVMFGVMHLNPVQTVGATLLGLAMGWVYYRTGSLWPTIWIHFVNNSLGSLGLWLTAGPASMSENFTREWIGNDTYYVALLVLCAAATYGCYVLLNRWLPRLAWR